MSWVSFFPLLTTLFVLAACARHPHSLPIEKEVRFLEGPSPQVFQQDYALPAGMEADVALLNPEFETVERETNLSSLKEPSSWHPTRKLPFLEQNLPGVGQGFLSMTESASKIHVKVQPVGWHYGTRKLRRLKKVRLKLTFHKKSDVQNTTPLSLILTSQKLEKGALALQKVHAEKGTQSEVVWIESLTEEAPIEETDLPPGYQDPKDRDAHIQDYRYDLARKITHYLHRRFLETSGPRFVTILGDAGVVPPSYYFGISGQFTRIFAPTDQCYGATEKCLSPQAAVGRLPFSSDEEVEAYLFKVKNYFNQVSALELGIYGGKAFRSQELYPGELSALRVIDKETTHWNSAKKFFWTKGLLNKKTLFELFEGRTRGFYNYYLDHGTGNELWAEKESLSSNEILNLPVSKFFPIVVSTACSGAAFDSLLSKDNPLEGNLFQKGNLSVGEALLKSKAGAIAYVGNTRLAIGDPVYQLDEKGNLNLLGSTYALNLFEGFFERVENSTQGKLGEVWLATLKGYLKSHSAEMNQDRHAWTYFIPTLLGDPTLELPRRKIATLSNPLAVSNLSLEKKEGQLLSFLKDESLSFQAPIDVNAEFFQIFKEGAEIKKLSLESSLEKSGEYFLKLENKTSVPRERQVWFRTAP